MTNNQKVAYVQAQASAALIEALGMIAENTFRDRQGNSIAYGTEAFDKLILDYGLHHNALMALFHGD